MRNLSNLVAAGVVATVLAGCSAPVTPRSTAARSAPASPGVPASASARPVTTADAASCPVTRPGPFVPPAGVDPSVLFGADSSHGNADLWVGGLPDRGIFVAGPDFVDPDGSIGVKFGWYRIATGMLTITGRRLDAPAPPATGRAGTGYGDSGFQSSGVTFPTEGCWEITGTVGRATLTFVVFVIKS